jgi:hypothetical protein
MYWQTDFVHVKGDLVIYMLNFVFCLELENLRL